MNGHVARFLNGLASGQKAATRRWLKRIWSRTPSDKRHGLRAQFTRDIAAAKAKAAEQPQRVEDYAAVRP